MRSDGDALSRLHRGSAVFGALQTLADGAVTGTAISLGFDFVILDREHGARDHAAHRLSLAQLAASRAFSVVRIAPGEDDAIASYAGWGTDAILVPDLRSATEAQRLTAIARSARPGDTPLLFAMIESPEGVSQAAQIAACDGVSGLGVGPNDLSRRLGQSGGFGTTAYLAALESVEQAALANGKLVGARPHGPFSCADLIARGHRFLTLSVDIAALGEAMRADLTAARTLEAAR